MKMLVTGGAGFIGSFIVDRLVREGHQVRIFDNLDPQVHPGSNPPDYLNTEAEFIKGDVRDYGAFKAALGDIEVVFHEAAAVGVGQSQYEIKYYTDVNIGGTSNLLDIIVNTKNRVAKIVLPASMSSYGEGPYECATHGRMLVELRPEEQLKKGEWELKCPECGQDLKPVPTTEEHPLGNSSIYAITKRVQEDMVINIGTTYHIPVVCLRYFNVYGPRQSLSNPYTGVAAIFMSRIKNDHRPLVFEDGVQSRDFISVHDIVQANMLAMEKDAANYRSYNVGSGRSISIIEIASILNNLYGKELEPEVANKFRKGDIRHCFSDISKIRKELGFSPSKSFEEGMKELIEWSRTAESTDMVDKATEELREKGLIE